MSNCGSQFYFLGNKTKSQQADSISDYLPDDETFIAKNVSGTTLRRSLEVFGKRLNKYSELVNLYTLEYSPDCANQLMSEWESVLGIPDDCFIVEGQTLETRRRNALIKIGKMNVQTIDDFLELSDTFEINATVESGIDYVNRTGNDFPGGDLEARFTIVITFINESESFPFTFPMTFGSEILGILQCIFDKIKPANCNVLFIEESAEVVGSFYWSMNEPPTASKYNFFSTAKGNFDSAISLQIGDTISFTYQANSGTGQEDRLISSFDETNYLGWDNSDLADFSGFTLTVNGSPVSIGGELPNGNSFYSFNGRYEFHEVVLTATSNTDVYYVSGDSTANASPQMFIQNLEIVTQSRTYFYAMDSDGNTIQTDSNGSGNDLNLSSSIFWNEQNVMRNTGENELDVVLATDSFNSATQPLFGQSSLRSDNTGNSVTFNSTRYLRDSTDTIPIRYDSGFTGEMLFRLDSFSSRGSINGNACGALSSFRNVSVSTLWTMRCDNWNDPSETSNVYPCFSLLQRNSLYSTALNFSNNEADVRSSVPAVSGRVYHFIFTIRPSNNTIELWVDGVSVGSQNFDSNWFIGNGTAPQNLLDASQETFLNIGPCYVDGAWRGNQGSGVQDLRIHLLEADQSFATQQYERNTPAS